MNKQELAIQLAKQGKSICLIGAGGCVDKDTEFLTPQGWKFISEYSKGDLVGQVSKEGINLSFTEPCAYIKEPCKEFNRIVNKRGVDQVICDEHMVAYVIDKDKNTLRKKPLKDVLYKHENNISGFRASVPLYYNYEGYKDIGISDSLIRLGVALKADGSLSNQKTGYYTIRLKKKRKVERFIKLLEINDYEYKVYDQISTGYKVFSLHAKWCSKTLGEWMFCLKNQAAVIIDEVKHWDGRFDTKGNRVSSFFTNKQEEADVIQYCANINGYRATISTYDRVGEDYFTGGKFYTRKSLEYVVTISKQSRASFLYKDVRNTGYQQSIERVQSLDGFKYCFTVPSGFLVLRRGGKVFISGNCGKSHTVKQIITDKSIIVAPTSVAAINVDGETAHSVFSLSHGLQTDSDRNRITPQMMDLFGKFSDVDYLVIDEAFAFRADLLDVIDYKLRKIREIDLPFGGLQVILSGDMMQNRPIVSQGEARHFSRNYKSPFIFDSKVWKELNPEVCVLTKSYRNENQDQLDALNAIRLKDSTPTGSDGKPAWMAAVDYVNELATHGSYDPESDLYLCSYKKDAAKINEVQYNKIKSPEFVYHAKLTSGYKKSNAQVPLEIKLKVGAKVMFRVNNREAGYYNGLQGVVKYLTDDCIIVETEDGVEVVVEEHEWEDTKYSRLNGKLKKSKTGTMKQYPLMLAYSATIHLVQGLTLNRMTADLGKDTFANGMLYVCLSRLRDLRNLTLVRPIAYSDVKVDNKALEFIKKYS